MKLFLSGGGKEPSELDKKFLKVVNRTKPLLYIPIAMDEKIHTYSECFEWMKNYFSKLNFKNIEMQTDLKKIKDLSKYGAIYIGGGNTPYLLKELKESGFWAILEDAINKGLPIAGGSAGAIIFAKTIIPSLSSDENKVGLKDFTAFDKLEGYEIWAHYGEDYDEKIKKFIKKNNLGKMLALQEDAGIYVNDDFIEVIGKPAFVFDNCEKKKIEVGEKLK